MNNNKFNFFVPLQKGEEAKGSNYLMKIKGVASSKSVDSDGETLDPSGFDFSDFLKTGMINWNHNSTRSSTAICGKPTAARVINSGKDFYVEGVLFNNAEGRAVADLIKVLANEPDRQLGWSIEGQAIERHPMYPKRITKARISGIALTHCPKNKTPLLKS